MYCEYYKLYLMVLNGINTNEEINKTFNNNHEKYDDLDPHREYSFGLIVRIYNDIMEMLFAYIDWLDEKNLLLNSYKIQNETGINIDNFVSSYEHDINITKNKFNLFVIHIDFFHVLHLKYLSRLLDKIVSVRNQLEKDIKFDEILSNNNQKDNNELDEHDEHDEQKDADVHNELINKKDRRNRNELNNKNKGK